MQIIKSGQDRATKRKSLKMLPENRDRRCWGERCRETVPEIGGGDWKGPPVDSSEVVRWNNQLVGGGWSESQSRWHVSDSGEIGRHSTGTLEHCHSLIGKWVQRLWRGCALEYEASEGLAITTRDPVSSIVIDRYRTAYILRSLNHRGILWHVHISRRRHPIACHQL